MSGEDTRDMDAKFGDDIPQSHVDAQLQAY